jgi:hypothetical protein
MYMQLKIAVGAIKRIVTLYPGYVSAYYVLAV